MQIAATRGHQQQKIIFHEAYVHPTSNHFSGTELGGAGSMPGTVGCDLV